MDDAAIHRVLRMSERGCQVRFQGHSGSPRASSPRDDKVCEGRPRDNQGLN